MGIAMRGRFDLPDKLGSGSDDLTPLSRNKKVVKPASVLMLMDGVNDCQRMAL
jgi:hypothetical protein